MTRKDNTFSLARIIKTEATKAGIKTVREDIKEIPATRIIKGIKVIKIIKTPTPSTPTPRHRRIMMLS